MALKLRETHGLPKYSQGLDWVATARVVGAAVRVGHRFCVDHRGLATRWWKRTKLLFREPFLLREPARHPKCCGLVQRERLGGHFLSELSRQEDMAALDV